MNSKEVEIIRAQDRLIKSFMDNLPNAKVEMHCEPTARDPYAKHMQTVINFGDDVKYSVVLGAPHSVAANTDEWNLLARYKENLDNIVDHLVFAGLGSYKSQIAHEKLKVQELEALVAKLTEELEETKASVPQTVTIDVDTRGVDNTPLARKPSETECGHSSVDYQWYTTEKDYQRFLIHSSLEKVRVYTPLLTEGIAVREKAIDVIMKATDVLEEASESIRVFK